MGIVTGKFLSRHHIIKKRGKREILQKVPAQNVQFIQKVLAQNVSIGQKVLAQNVKFDYI